MRDLPADLDRPKTNTTARIAYGQARPARRWAPWVAATVARTVTSATDAPATVAAGSASVPSTAVVSWSWPALSANPNDYA